MKKVQLYSAGMDSYIVSKLWKPDVKLYFDYGIAQNEQEKKYLPNDVIIKKIDLKEYMMEDGHNTIYLRNLLFATLAVNYGDVIAINGLKDDNHNDKKPEFAKKVTELFNSVLEKDTFPKSVQVVIPYGHLTKAELVFEYLKAGGTVEDIEKNSWSCHTPNGNEPCGKCKPCKARKRAIEEALEMIKNKK